MNKRNQVIASYQDGNARVTIGGRTLNITSSDNKESEYFCPVDLLSASLGSWITLTVSAVAENKKISLSGFEARISKISDLNQEMNTSFSVEIELPTSLDARERTILFNAAKRCDVTKILEGDIDFFYNLIED